MVFVVMYASEGAVSKQALHCLNSVDASREFGMPWRNTTVCDRFSQGSVY